MWSIPLEEVPDENFIADFSNIRVMAPQGTFNHQGFPVRTKFPHTVQLERQLWERELIKEDMGAYYRIMEFWNPKQIVIDWLFENLNEHHFTFRLSRQGAMIHFANESDVAFFRLSHTCKVTMTSVYERHQNDALVTDGDTI